MSKSRHGGRAKTIGIERKSFTKFSLPPRIQDFLLERLSTTDHAKYLSHYATAKATLKTLRERGAAERAIRDFGEVADWFRNVDAFFRRWTAEWAYAYIHHTHPALAWPDGGGRTIDPQSFAFLWFYASCDRETLHRFRLQTVDERTPCTFCRTPIRPPEIVLRFGVPTCGCERKLLRPLRAAVVVSEDFPFGLVPRFEARCREQRMLDVGADPFVADVLFGFVNKRTGNTEGTLRRAASEGIPTYVLGVDHELGRVERSGSGAGGLPIPQRRNDV